MKKVFQIFVFIAMLILAIPLNSQTWSNSEFYSYENDPAFQPRQQDVDILQVKCEAFIDGPKNYIDGKATLSFRTFYHPTDSLQIRVANLNLKEVKIDGKVKEYRLQNGEAIIYTNEKLEYNTEHKLEIVYDAHPNGGLHFTGWGEDEKYKREQIWAHSLQNWCPYSNIKHDLCTTEMIITFDKDYKVFANGLLQSKKDNGDGTNTWHYKLDKPHVVYLHCLMIGDFGVKNFKTDRGLDLQYLFFKDMPERFDVCYKYSKEMFDVFEEETGINYPWGIYRNMPAADYLFGGMECTTSTLFGGYMYVDERAWWMRNYVNVNAHELAHQWFGNYVSNINKEIWLAESFPTYYAKIFEKSVFGEEYYQWVRDQEFDLTFEDARKNNYPVAHSRGGRGRYYMKGSLVLDMMRDYLGEDGYKAAIKHYLTENAHKVVAYDDFLRAVREATGQSMEWFFEQWIRRGGEPHYKIDYRPITMENKAYTLVNVAQIHKINNLTSYFKMPIEIEVHYKDGTKTSQKPWIDGANTEVMIQNEDNKEIAFILFDPNRHIVKKMTFDRSIDELAAQAEKSENMIDKLDAIRAMKKLSLEKKIDAFYDAYPTNEYHLFRGEIIKQIVSDEEYSKNAKAVTLIKNAIKSGDELTVRSVVSSIDYIPKTIKREYETILQDSCYRNVELALDDLCRSFPKSRNKYLKATKNEIGWQGRNIRV
ncbi:MAG: hypothetical protein B7C24_12530, partial [Bacteroidetes bacterium 4572_77]